LGSVKIQGIRCGGRGYTKKKIKKKRRKIVGKKDLPLPEGYLFFKANLPRRRRVLGKTRGVRGGAVPNGLSTGYT